MAEELSEFPRINGRGPAGEFKYAKFCDGRIWKLVRGTDFACTVSSLRSNIGRYASLKLGLMMRCVVIDDKTVIVQACQKSSK